MITYTRRVPVGDPEALEATVEHVRAHLSAVADADDDPTTRAQDVEIDIVEIEDGKTGNGVIRVDGRLDAPRSARYDREGFDPYEGVPEELRAEANR